MGTVLMSNRLSLGENWRRKINQTQRHIRQTQSRSRQTFCTNRTLHHRYETRQENRKQKMRNDHMLGAAVDHASKEKFMLKCKVTEWNGERMKLKELKEEISGALQK